MPDDLLGALREAAERDRRSLTQEVIHLLALAVRDAERPKPRSADVEAQVAAWRELAGKWVSSVDQETETESILERRSSGREVEL
jgi:hypothetical protein